MVDLMLEAQGKVEQAWIRDGVLQRFLDSPPPDEEEEEEEETGWAGESRAQDHGAEAAAPLSLDVNSKETERAAGTVQRCVRCWLARYEAMVRTNERFYAALDEDSGYYYYVDDWTGEAAVRPPRDRHPSAFDPAPPSDRCRRRRDFVVPPAVLAQVVRVEWRVRRRRRCRRRGAGGVGRGRERGVGVAARVGGCPGAGVAARHTLPCSTTL